MNYKNLHWLWLSLPVVILDQITKWLAVNQLVPLQQKVIFSFLNGCLSFNKGSAFGFLHRAGGWQRWFLIAIALIISISIIVWLCRISRSEKSLSLGLALIFSGAIGNLWDRMILGHVIDFIQFHFNHWYFPTFNIADSAISLGALLLIINLSSSSSRLHRLE